MEKIRGPLGAWINDMTKHMNELQEYEKTYGIHFDIIPKLDGNCYVLSNNGSLSYEECFGKTDNNYCKEQRYELVLPEIVVKYYNYYIVAITEESMLWLRGRKANNGNYEFDCCADKFADIIESL